ncbi:ATP phosphoribosyltransferase [Raineya orbicola]|jgi:ATP phosphoribosyltransferase|uniref:ATP phosphoribosyltransferase n=1 Tax=Raineya orbicola TaxID=2016530 RepID=A0A2N3IKY8_9BACT|nr:ATP phosphoribosyltransferase [Raineya orbicola]PKQ70948.1 hisG: ATP phosphoribosyltransferase [Raineya orbicola]
MSILRIALQKSGRLSESSLALIKECGIDFQNGTGKLKSEASNFPAEFLFLRDDDIPGYVADGVADIGIIGENVMVEKNQEVRLIERLGFSKCRLSVAVPKGKEYKGLQDLQGIDIATSYPRILSNFLQKHQISARIHEISGSVEIAPSIGLAEAICDIVSSGSTLMSNGLKEVEVVFHSEAVLIGNPNISTEKQKILEKLLFRIHAVQNAKKNKYILLNAPKNALGKIVEILPGMKSPTVLPLAIEDWCSVHSVIHEDDFWEIIESLKAAGAEGILVVPIEKMIR